MTFFPFYFYFLLLFSILFYFILFIFVKFLLFLSLLGTPLPSYHGRHSRTTLLAGIIIVALRACVGAAFANCKIWVEACLTAGKH